MFSINIVLIIYCSSIRCLDNLDCILSLAMAYFTFYIRTTSFLCAWHYFLLYPFLRMTPFICQWYPFSAKKVLSLLHANGILSADAILSLQVTTFLWGRHLFFADKPFLWKLRFFSAIDMLRELQCCLWYDITSLHVSSFLCRLASILYRWHHFSADDNPSLWMISFPRVILQ